MAQAEGVSFIPEMERIKSKILDYIKSKVKTSAVWHYEWLLNEVFESLYEELNELIADAEAGERGLAGFVE